MLLYFFIRLNALKISPTQSTTEVASVIPIHSPQVSGTVLKTEPPKLTTSTCPTIIAIPTVRNPSLLNIFLKAESFVPNVFALNMFQNCNITNTVKKIVRLRNPSGVPASMPPA